MHHFFRCCLLIVLLGTGGASLAAQASLVINEAMSRNGTSLRDANHKAPDWVELFNASKQTLNLAGYRLSDGDDFGTAWPLPDTNLNAGDHLLVFAGDDVAPADDSPVFFMRASGFAVDVWSNKDGMRFAALPQSGDFEAVVRVRALNAVHPFSLAGLMLRESLEEGGRFVALFCSTQERQIFEFLARAVDGGQPEHRRRLLHLRYPNNWLRIQRRGDSVLTWISNDGYFWQAHHDIHIPSLNSKVQIGLALTAFEAHKLASAYYSDFSVDGQAIDYTELTAVELNTEIEGESRIRPGIYADFKLNSAGEKLYLWNADGEQIDEMALPPLPADISYGRSPDGGEEVRFFGHPTPEGSNAAGAKGIMPSAAAVPAAGMFSGAQNIQLIAQHAEARIHYSLDGSEPSEQSPLYTGEAIHIDTTAVLRTRVFRDDFLPSTIATQTYLIDESSRLPILSFVTDPCYLWDDDKGIYTRGPNAGKDYPYYGANFWRIDEVPAHVEMFEAGAGRRFGVSGGARIHGWFSRTLPQKALRFALRKRYNQSQLLYNIFKQKDFLHSKSFIMRTGGNDWEHGIIRDGLTAILVDGLAFDKRSYQPAIMYVNGEFWGMQSLRERLDADYLGLRYGFDPDDILLIENAPQNWAHDHDNPAVEGSSREYLQMMDSLDLLPDGSSEALAFLARHVDLQSTFHYVASQVYAANGDWPVKNIQLWKGPGVPWRWLWLDLDFSLHKDNRSRPTVRLLRQLLQQEKAWMQTPYLPHLLYRILKQPQLLTMQLNVIADLLNTQYQSERVIHVVDSLGNYLRDAIQRHQLRWPESAPHWEAHLDTMRQFTRLRPPVIRENVVQEFDLDGIATLRVRVEPAGAASIDINTLSSLTPPWEGIYFRGLPLPLVLHPSPGYSFEGWSEESLPAEPTVELTLSGDLELTAYLRKADVDKEPAPVINEIMYNSAEDADAGDWVELFNPSDKARSLSGWVLQDDNEDHRYIFPPGTLLAPRAFLVVCRDSVRFRRIHPTIHPLQGNLGFGLGRGDEVRLRNAAAILIDSVGYSTAQPWPSAADGRGASLELIHPGLDNSQAVNWNARAARSTPGAPNTGVVSDLKPSASPVAGKVEIMPNPARNTIRLGITLRRKTDLRIVIVDLLGRERLLFELDAFAAGPQRIPLPIDGLEAGAYYLRLADRDEAPFGDLEVPLLIVGP